VALVPIELEFKVLIFTQGGKPEKNPLGKGENQQTTQLIT
jgi:hypothetical protein